MDNVAIIGTGIAGMGCAHHLQKRYDLTIFEKDNYVGGHTNTVSVDEDGQPVYMDTGFMDLMIRKKGTDLTTISY